MEYKTVSSKRGANMALILATIATCFWPNPMLAQKQPHQHKIFLVSLIRPKRRVESIKEPMQETLTSSSPMATLQSDGSSKHKQ